MLKPANKSQKRSADLVATLDFGASKVACIIARPGDDPGDIDVLGAACHGVTRSDGRAMNADMAEKCIRAAVDGAERMAGDRLHEISIAVNGRYLYGRRIGVDLDIAGGVITHEDVDDALGEGMTLAAGDGFTALTALPIAFRVDGEEFFVDPTGLTGRVLCTELLSVSVRQSLLDNLSAIVERCGLRAHEFVPAPFAAGEATLTDDEKELGAVLIDIGAATTGFVVYDNGAPVEMGGVAVGGGHITKDIATIFGAPLADAERVKTLHGSALTGPGDEHRFVDFSALGASGEGLRATRADINEVIAPRLEEIFELVSQKLSNKGGHRTIVRRAVLTGGGALLVGACETAERVLSMKTRVARPTPFSGLPEATSGPGFSVSVGAVQKLLQLNTGRDASLSLVSPLQSRYANPLKMVGGIEAWLRTRF